MNFHRSLKIIFPALLSAVVLGSAGRAIALDRDVAYLHALQSRGFGDVGVAYLEALDKGNEISPAMREVFDLEMSKSLRAEAKVQSDAAQRGALLARSQKYLDQFVKNYPNHAEALQAQISSAEMMFDHAQEALSRSRSVKDKAEKATTVTQARAELAQVKAILTPSVDKLLAQLKAIGPRPSRTINRQVVLKDRESMTRKEKDQEAKRMELEFDLIRTEGELALVDYFTAQTYTEPTDDSKRTTALNAAFKMLDAYYQKHRGDDPITQLGRSGFIGAEVAHTWSGKAAQEIGNRELAQAVFDEVLQTFPDPPEPNTTVKEEPTGLEPVLARAKYYSLQLMAGDPKQQKDYLEQAKDFITNYKKLFRLEWGYQATSLDVAKQLMAAADKETNAKEKAEKTKQAVAILKDMASVRSEFQDQATQLLQTMARGANPTTVDEALEFIKLAFADKDWPKAEALCQSALELLKKSNKKDADAKELQGRIQDWLAQCQIQPVFDDFKDHREPFKQEKYQAWLDTAEKIAQENKKSVIAPKAASFAVYCAAVLDGKARSDEQQAKTPAAKKAAAAQLADASKRLQEVTDFILTSFPNSSEADEARLSGAKAKWADGNVAEAIAVFEGINPKAEKYPEALRLIGELRVEQFQSELRKPAEKQDKSLIEKYRAAAVKALTESVKEQISLLKPNSEVPPELIKTQLLLARVHMQVKEYSEAVQVLQPLVDEANAAAKGSTTELNDTMLQIFSAAVKAYMAMDDFKKAGAAGNVLIQLGPDKRDVNIVLVDFVRRLDLELRDLHNQLDKLADASPKETESIRTRISSIKDMLSTMVVKLADRKQLDANTMVFLGSLYTDIDNFDGAKTQYVKVQDMPEATEKLKLWVGAQLVEILGKEGQLDKATDEIKKLRDQKPNNLDFMKVEAQLWQDWGQKDPRRYETAIQKWSNIRLRLQHQKVKAGASYYDSVYNAAFCCLMEANKLALDPSKKANAIKKAEEGQKILKSELIPNPKLDGPQSVKRFNDLLGDLAKFVKKLEPPAAA